MRLRSASRTGRTRCGHGAWWRRYAIAASFGLIHGLGFSGYLRALLGGEESIVGPLLAFNVGLFLVAMRTLGVEPALYSILTFLAAARTLDFVIYGLEDFTAVTIFSRESRAIKNALIGDLGRGVSVLRGYGGLSGDEQEVLYCVVTRLEVGRVKTIVRAHDRAAFVVYHALADVDGGVVKRPRHH